jgi:hypothetical protein
MEIGMREGLDVGCCAECGGRSVGDEFEGR